MKITAITAQVRNPDRVNVLIDGQYQFSLDISQLIDLGIRVGRICSEADLDEFKKASQFGKIYVKALRYCLMRPHSTSEISNYLARKNQPSRDKNGQMQPPVPVALTKHVFDRLVEKGYVNDQKFAEFWVENRLRNKLISRRQLSAELHVKGVARDIIDQVLSESDLNDSAELQSIIAKKRTKYPDNQKLIAYLARLGFNYDDIQQALIKQE
jgi:regulatory protein